jgi:hypothetical protein
MNVAAVTTDTDLPAAVDGCRDLVAIAFGEVSTVDTFERACRRADRKAAARPQDDPRLKHLRRLLKDGVSLERAWSELNRGDGRTPEALVEALMFSLRRGVGEIDKPDTRRRLAALNKRQLKQVCRRVQNFNPHIATPWSREEATALVSNWRILRG